MIRFIAELLNCLTGCDYNERTPRQQATPTRQLPGAGVLLPGLPDHLVQDCILPRIPWHVRPLLMATNFAWRELLNGHPNHEDSSVKVENLEGLGFVISLYDPVGGHWRNLPTLPCASLMPMPIFAGFRGSRKIGNCIQVDCVCGKVIAAAISQGLDNDYVAHVWILGIEGGMWKWEERPCIHTQRKPISEVHSKMIVMDGKLFMAHVGTWDETKPLVYDVVRDEWTQLPDAFHVPEIPLDWYYHLRFNDGKSMFLFAWGLRNGRSIRKVFDLGTLSWMDFNRTSRPGAAQSGQRCGRRQGVDRIFGLLW